MYQVDSAIIMAAGISSRLAPLSYEVPKALLKVKGEILIERQIQQLQEAGIEHILIVTGYMKEKFEYLKDKYHVEIVDNPVYDRRNNHATIYYALQFMQNTYICSGDNYYCTNVFQKQEKQAYYAAVFEEGDTKEWCILTDEQGRITGVEIGGKNAWVMRGHAFLTKEITDALRPYIENAYAEEHTAGLFWEHILVEHLNEYAIYTKKYKKTDIVEFDTLDELRAFDHRYLEHTGSIILEKICLSLACSEKELSCITPIKNQGKVTGIRFVYCETAYRYDYETMELEQLVNG